MATKRLFMITGDYSGDVHAAKVAKALREQEPDIELAAVGGLNLQAAEVTLLSDQSKMGRVGFGSVLGAPYHYLLGQKILKFLASFQPDAVLLIDYGVFNLYMAAKLKQRGFKVFYFIPPQVWATRKGRIRKIKAHVDHVFCIFPFEETLYQSHDIPVTYVGHPLVGELPPPVDRTAFCREHDLNPEVPVVGLFPGSRKLEIDYLLPEIIASMPLIRKQEPLAQFVMARAGSLNPDYFHQRLDEAMQRLPRYNRLPITILENQNHAVMSASDMILAASGTVTLEAALYSTPMVILYKMHPVVAAVGFRLMQLPCIGLPNILTDPHHPIVDELLQNDANPEAIAKSAIPLLDITSPQWNRQKLGFEKIQHYFNVGGAAQNVAQGLLQLMAGEPVSKMDAAHSSF